MMGTKEKDERMDQGGVTAEEKAGWLDAASARLPAGAEGMPSAERWQMSRAGIFNFWYYDDQEFELEAGRLILRGANGSGKSVTMQSFLPLVLDGDKRPHRLDPFGSRDRRIEYYLLLEGESAHEERTAYLWLEFANPAKGLYKTVGIGLRARRGATQVGFWGFVLQDGRRVNRDFWLYDRTAWLEGAGKLALPRRALEEKIGSGGQVVQEQSAYRELVNKALFQFQEGDAYQDLLQLMVQLRSPKLSKDFKPTAIYDILTEALPPLLDEELRSLSEVLEDMDQISDRLDELQAHRKEMERLQGQYDKYNRYLLYRQSQEVLESRFAAEQAGQRLVHEETQRTEALEEEAAAESARLQAEQRSGEARTELEVLSRHEAMEKQRELETAENRLGENERHLDAVRARNAAGETRLRRLGGELESARASAERLAGEQAELLLDQEGLARELEFAEHDVYHRYWSGGVPEDDRWRGPWRRDLTEHRQRLGAALQTARAEKEAGRLVQELELQLGELRRTRDEAERERTTRSQAAEAQREALREAIVQWRQELKLLPLDSDALRESLQALSALTAERRDYAAVKRPALAAADAKRGELLEARAALHQQREQAAAEQAQLEQEREAWRHSREPEPARTAGRLRARSRRAHGSGAPLYEVCEFAPHVSEDVKAQVEETLERAGLLDAWISPDGLLGRIGEDEDEAWVRPDPQAAAYTLGDLLVPVPSPESGLLSETIDAVLQTFVWEERAERTFGTGAAGGAVLTSAGGYALGPLAGSVAGKERAEYIGKETRRRTRALEIERLTVEIGSRAARIAQLDEERAGLEALVAAVRSELDAFPEDGRLQEALDDWLRADHSFRALWAQEERMQERLREKVSAWRSVQQRLAEETAGWSRLKREAELDEAVRLCTDYERGVSDLLSLWSRYSEAERSQRRLGEELETLEVQLEEDRAVQDELEGQVRTFRAQAERLKRMIEEMGIADLYAQISELKRELTDLERTHRNASDRREKARIQLGRLQERLAAVQADKDAADQALVRAAGGWHAELRLGLVREWADGYRPDLGDAELRRLCADIVKAYDSQYANRTRESVTTLLLEEFNAVRHSLVDYSLESAADERTGRITIVSRRDRLHPEPPRKLLEELTELETEQRGLLSEKDRELYEEIILRSVGKAIRHKIHRAQQWVKRMNRLMSERNTSSGLRLSLEWMPKAARSEQQLDTAKLVDLLMRDAHRLQEEEIESIISHFRDRIVWAKNEAQEERESLRRHINALLDYREWFQFVLSYRKGEQTGYRELTDSRFNVLSGGERAMAMYIPLFAATYSRYSDASPDAPKLISLDEAFAGVDEENMRDMFQLLTDMGFDYMMTSQVLWGCYDTVPRLAVYEIYRPKDVDFVTTFHYRWNGRRRELVDDVHLRDGADAEGEDRTDNGQKAGGET